MEKETEKRTIHDMSNKDWIKRLDEKLTKLGAKQGNFLKGKTGVYIPKKKS